MRNEPIYKIANLKQTYAGRTVLDIERLDVQDREILGLVGPSGAGKSTLLRLLNFLESPSSGQIVFRNQPLTGHIALAVRRQVTTVFQRPVLLRESVRANVAYGLALRGERSNGRVDEMLAVVGLDQLANAPAAKLSGGEMQRVALARALVLNPTVLLLDEPTANLDPYNVGLLEEIVAKTNRERGTTIVLVTHNVFQAKRLAHRVGFVLGGRLVEIAGVTQFFDAPDDPRTTAFVRGDMVY
jgi:tungstate transport system ATP-binding protein